MTSPASPAPDLGALTEETRRALADDPRLGQLDVCITLRGQRALLTGHVVTQDRRRLVAEVVAEHLPGYEIDNATTTIEDLPEPPATAEELGADR
jgi:osmotically-inducible protein OsmY